jgi:hypothetical protein
MTKFTDQLFDDLMRDHSATLAGTTRSAAPRRYLPTRPVLLAAGAGGVAAAAALGTLAAGSGTPAYAVTANRGGSVTLAVYQQSGIAGANAKLQTLGDKQVVVVPVRPGCPSMSALPKPAAHARADSGVAVGTARSGDPSVTVEAHGIPAGDVLVVAVETTGKGMSVGMAGLTRQPAPACVSIPASVEPGGSGRSAGTSGGSATARPAGN